MRNTQKSNFFPIKVYLGDFGLQLLVKKVNLFFFLQKSESDKTNEPGNNKSGQMTFGDLAPEMVTKGK